MRTGTTNVLLLSAMVVTVPWAAIFVRASDAHPLTLAFGRLILSGAVFWVLSLRFPTQKLSVRSWWLIAAAGGSLAAHFMLWITSVNLTTVASSTSLVATGTLWAALLSVLFLRESPAFLSWIGMAVATISIIVIGGVDVGSSRALVGDAFSLASAVFAALYFVISRSLRDAIPLARFLAIISFVSAGFVAGVIVVSGVPFVPLSWEQLGAVAGLGFGSSAVNHGLCNAGVRRMRAYVIELTVLFEPIGASFLIWLLAGEVADTVVYFGGIALLSGVALVVIGERRARKKLRGDAVAEGAVF
jgi:drug/metabolite transporter (DMT)-like permease